MMQPGQPLYKVADLDTLTCARTSRRAAGGGRLGDSGRGACGRRERLTHATRARRVDLAGGRSSRPRRSRRATSASELVYAVKVRVANPDGVLKIGMPARRDPRARRRRLTARPPEGARRSASAPRRRCRRVASTCGRASSSASSAPTARARRRSSASWSRCSSRTRVARPVLGHDVVRDLWALRVARGLHAGAFSLYPDLSVEENLRFFASVFGTTVRARATTRSRRSTGRSSRSATGARARSRAG
jgi:hypothetical protein